MVFAVAGARGRAAPARPDAARPPSPILLLQALRLALRDVTPSRPAASASLKAATRDAPFDVLVVGGGATGTGCALDAATR